MSGRASATVYFICPIQTAEGHPRTDLSHPTESSSPATSMAAARPCFPFTALSATTRPMGNVSVGIQCRARKPRLRSPRRGAPRVARSEDRLIPFDPFARSRISGRNRRKLHCFKTIGISNFARARIPRSFAAVSSNHGSSRHRITFRQFHHRLGRVRDAPDTARHDRLSARRA